MAKSPEHEHLVRWHASLINEHRAWLARFNEPERVKLWDELLESATEDALCEALVRRLLNDHVYIVSAEEDLSAGGPDFRCLQMNRHFYVETTCLTIDAVTEATGLIHLSRQESGYRPLTPCLFDACNGKALACAGRDDAPCLLAVATLHRAASEIFFHDRAAVEALLTSGPQVAHELSEVARESVAAMLLCGFGIEPATVHGVLNPDAAQPFDRRLLPEIPFCQVQQTESGEAPGVDWV